MSPPSLLRTVKISKSPVRSELKAIRLPSGDHTGLKSVAEPLVTWRGSEPSAPITQMSKLPSRSL
jgi:hypothetical protein